MSQPGRGVGFFFAIVESMDKSKNRDISGQRFLQLEKRQACSLSLVYFY